ncbi:hypothetical protein [Parageobacillus thermoglucosidasius]|uniref:hypothetical protein n=1 Tax=Parageobacillus thermoglucosidasius TaxID=1426 RepID=UPI000F61CCEF|nr:hypothetical protein [Parageobacillus thermoglucosidasius]GCD83166.1 hypothetical protein PTHTG4_22290 [Parageobacillus thermoglucosidasius]GMO01565.1 hypothetical protein PthstB1num2_36050 [Parageobacillus thermoglucosidasius]
MENKTLFEKVLQSKKIKNEHSLRMFLYGCSAQIILSKDIFVNNKELIGFTLSLGLEFRDYVYASRTTIVSRIIRELEKKNLEQLEIYRDSLLAFLSKKFEYSISSNKRTTNKNPDNYVKNTIEKYRRGK